MKKEVKSKSILIMICILSVILIGLIIFTIFYFNSLIVKDSPEALKHVNDTEYGSYENGLFFSYPQEEHEVTDEQGHVFIDNQLDFRVKQGTPKEKVEELARKYDATISGYFEMTDSYQFRFNRTYTFDELLLLKKEFECIDFVEWVYLIDKTLTKLTPCVMSYDPKWDSWDEKNPSGNNWGLEAVRTPSAWKDIDHIDEVNVGIVDTMFLTEHEDLDFATDYPPMNPLAKEISDDHGTHVSGTIAAIFNNEKGISGISPNVNLYGITTKAIAQDINQLKIALVYLIKDKKCKVINLSINDNLLSFAASQGNENAITNLKNISMEIERTLEILIDEGHDFVICQSVGNQWNDNLKTVSADYRYSMDENSYYGFVPDINGTECGNVDAKYNPLSYIENEKVKKRIIVVGAIQNDNNGQYSLANFSQQGERVDVTAPGVDIYSTSYKRILNIPISWYAEKFGTSMATPHVSGLAAMLFGVNPNLNGEQVKEIICDTSNEDVFNLIDSKKAIETAKTMGSISGRICNAETGENLKANIHIYSDGELYKTVNSSSETGEFLVHLPAGKYDIEVLKEGFKKYTLTVSFKERQEYIIDDPIALSEKKQKKNYDILIGPWENLNCTCMADFVTLEFNQDMTVICQLQREILYGTYTLNNGNVSIFLPGGKIWNNIYGAWEDNIDRNLKIDGNIDGDNLHIIIHETTYNWEATLTKVDQLIYQGQ